MTNTTISVENLIAADAVINDMYIVEAVDVENVIDWIKNNLLNEIIEKTAEKYTEKRIEEKVQEILKNHQSNTRKPKEVRERCICGRTYCISQKEKHLNTPKHLNFEKRREYMRELMRENGYEYIY